MRRSSLVLLCLGLSLLAAPTVGAADNVVHTTTRQHDVVFGPFPLGPMQGCFAYPGTITTVADVTTQTTEVVAGPNAGDLHVVIWADGTARVVADDPVAHPVVYTGRQLQIVQEFASADDRRAGRPLEASVAHFALTGSDGSTLQYRFRYRVLLVDGAPQLTVFDLDCIK